MPLKHNVELIFFIIFKVKSRAVIRETSDYVL